MIRVGFTLIGGNNWLGGAHYLRNLMEAVTRYAPGEIQPVLFVGTDVSEATLKAFRDLGTCEVVQVGVMNDATRSRALLSALVLGRYRPFVPALNEQNIDVVFEAASYFGWRVNMPAIAWMPDFQHRAMPGNFRPLGWLRRELGFRTQMRSKRMIMLSSSDALAA